MKNMVLLTAILGILAATALRAEFLRIEVEFAGSECASCVQSLENRLRKMRGVESVEFDAAQGRAALKLERGNRVRLWQVRDFVQQDGTRIRGARVSGRGKAAAGEGGFLLEVPESGQRYRLSIPAKIAGALGAVEGKAVEVAGAVKEWGGGGQTGLLEITDMRRDD